MRGTPREERRVNAEEPRRVRRDDVTQVITSVLEEYNRADAVVAGPDAVADAVMAAIEEHGFEVVARDPDRAR